MFIDKTKSTTKIQLGDDKNNQKLNTFTGYTKTTVKLQTENADHFVQILSSTGWNKSQLSAIHLQIACLVSTLITVVKYNMILHAMNQHAFKRGQNPASSKTRQRHHIMGNRCWCTTDNGRWTTKYNRQTDDRCT